MAQEKWLVDGPKTIDIELVRSLKVGLVGGNVDVIAHDEPGARIEVHSVSGKPLKVLLDGDRLEIDHPQLGWENWTDVFRTFSARDKADVSVMVPREVALKFGVVSATGLVSGLHTDASISSVSGDVVVDGLVGDLQLNSVSGELSVRGHRGRVAVKTVSGDVTASGEVPTFTCDGVSSDVVIDISGDVDEVRVNTVSGDVSARFDAQRAAAYTINTVSGKLQLDDDEIRGVRGRYSGRFGELEGRWLDFKANTVSGDVSVLHSVRA